MSNKVQAEIKLKREVKEAKAECFDRCRDLIRGDSPMAELKAAINETSRIIIRLQSDFLRKHKEIS